MISAETARSVESKNWKSGPYSKLRLPCLISRALVAMRLPALWRNTWSSLTTGTTPLLMISLSTAPGPTEGSWSASPIKTSLALGGTAARSRSARKASIIDTSSTRIRSAQSITPSVSVPSSRALMHSALWMVDAWIPEDSFIFCAACPVGAQQTIWPSGYFAW